MTTTAFVKRYSNTTLIINPRAGESNYCRIKGRIQLPDIERALNAVGIFPKIMRTRYKNHATDIATQCVKEGQDLVIVAGGDGTLNEVINGLAYSSVPLAVIPTGTVNVYAIERGIPRDLQAICQRIATGTPTIIDLGKVNQRYFLSMAGSGFDATVIKKLDTSLKKYIGSLAYLIGALKEVLMYKQRNMSIVIDADTSPIQVQQVVVSNSRYYGGNFTVSNSASITDGQLDVCYLKKVSIITLIKTLFQLKQSRPKGQGPLQCRPCKNVQIVGIEALHADAEYIGEGPANITVAAQAITVIG